MATHSNHFCSVPWEYLEVVATGDVYACCNGRQKKPVGNIWNSDLKTIWKGAAITDLRQSIRDGDFKGCGPCIYLDKKGGRVVERSKLNLFEKSYLNTESIFPQPQMIWLLIDRTCQLKCGSCRKDFLVEGKTNKIFALRDKVLSDPILNGTKTLWIDGSGEPLMSAAHLDLIRRAYDLLPKETDLGILTNGLLFKDEHESLSHAAVSKIKHVTVSIDAATPETYRLNRGASFDSLKQNLRYISDLKRSRLIHTFKIVMAVQQNNWRQMKLFVDMARDLGAVPWFTALTNWGTWTEAEYRARAVHLPGHPEHGEFCQWLGGEEFKGPGVLQYVLV